MVKNPYADIITQALDERRAVRTTFSGRSMAPTLTNGMLLDVRKAASEDVRAADVVLYRKGDQVVVHRVVRVVDDGKGRRFITKGDNQAYIESEHVPESSLIGVVRGAFFEDAPQRDILVSNKFVSASYVMMDSLAAFAMRSRTRVPDLVRSVFRRPVGAFFLTLKNSIHIIYIGMRYGRLLFRR